MNPLNGLLLQVQAPLILVARDSRSSPSAIRLTRASVDQSNGPSGPVMEPPFAVTIFLDPDIIVGDSPIRLYGQSLQGKAIGLS